MTSELVFPLVVPCTSAHALTTDDNTAEKTTTTTIQ